MRRILVRYISVALLLVGGAILLYACGEEAVKEDAAADELIMSEYSEDLTVIKSQNGRKSYHFTTPQLEGYTLGNDPYREFRKGVKIVTYKDDSVSTVDATLIANYAIHYSKRDLWEAKGNVVVEAAGGERKLYTQQLFWNAKTKRIYSNVDSKIELNYGRDVFYGEGFESDDAMTDWRFRRFTGQMEFEMRNRADSTAIHEDIQSGAVSPGARPDANAEAGKEAAKVLRKPEEKNPEPKISKKPPVAVIQGPNANPGARSGVQRNAKPMRLGRQPKQGADKSE